MSPQRFVVLLHEPGPNSVRIQTNHLDWMFEIDGQLRTWSTDVVDMSHEMVSTDADSLPDHRIDYLDIDGDIGQGRGSVRPIVTGIYSPVEVSEHRFAAWIESESGLNQMRMMIIIQCSFDDEVPELDETRRRWSLSLSPGR